MDTGKSNDEGFCFLLFFVTEEVYTWVDADLFYCNGDNDKQFQNHGILWSSLRRNTKATKTNK